MKTQDAIDLFGSKVAIAEALGISKQAVTEWGDDVPLGRQYQLQVVTNGALIADSHLPAAESPTPAAHAA
jgi:hypothetical protein